MPLTKIASTLSHNADVGIGGVLGLLTSLGFAVSTPSGDGDGGGVSLVQVVTSLCIAFAPMVVAAIRRWYKGEAAGDRVRAAKLRSRADKLRTMGTKDSVAAAEKLDLQADELEALAAEKEAKARGGVE